MSEDKTQAYTPTMKLRWVQIDGKEYPSKGMVSSRDNWGDECFTKLQQKWIGHNGEEHWIDVILEQNP